MVLSAALRVIDLIMNDLQELGPDTVGAGKLSWLSIAAVNIKHAYGINTKAGGYFSHGIQ